MRVVERNREGGDRADEFGITLDVENGLLELGAHGVHGFECIVLEDFFADFIPEIFLRIEFRRVGREVAPWPKSMMVIGSVPLGRWETRGSFAACAAYQVRSRATVALRLGAIAERWPYPQ